MERVLSVGQLNEYVRRTLAADPMLRGIRLRGEISNFKRHSAGHLYFSLKDEASRIACVMFRSQAEGLRLSPRDGMRAVLSGNVSLYTATGQYQFYVDSIREDGVGTLYEEFQRLKAQLEAEGLFDAGLKKPLPLLPRGVGIVTSPTGAVVHDIEQVALRRNPGVQLLLYPALVQGEGAAASLVRAIEALDKRADIDVIIVGRGGGSLEELWPFNEEAVARAIFRARTPIVSAVGHETDFSIADFVADVRAATPSAAAEIVVPRLSDLAALLSGYRFRMGRAAMQRVQVLGHRLDGAAGRLRAHRPDRHISRQRARLAALKGMLFSRAQTKIKESRLRLSGTFAQAPLRLGAGLSRRRFGLAALKGRLEALSPLCVLNRGYALVTDAEGAVLTDAREARPGDGVHIRLSRGGLDATVREVYDGSEKA